MGGGLWRRGVILRLEGVGGLLAVLFLLGVSVLSCSRISFDGFGFGGSSPFKYYPKQGVASMGFGVASSGTVGCMHMCCCNMGRIKSTISDSVINTMGTGMRRAGRHVVFFAKPFRAGGACSQ